MLKKNLKDAHSNSVQIGCDIFPNELVWFRFEAKPIWDKIQKHCKIQSYVKSGSDLLCRKSLKIVIFRKWTPPPHPPRKDRADGPGGRTGRKDRADGRTGRTDRADGRTGWKDRADGPGGRTGRADGPGGRAGRTEYATR